MHAILEASHRCPSLASVRSFDNSATRARRQSHLDITNQAFCSTVLRTRYCNSDSRTACLQLTLWLAAGPQAQRTNATVAMGIDLWPQGVLQVQQHEGVHGAEAGGAQPSEARGAHRHLHGGALPPRAHAAQRARGHHSPQAVVRRGRRAQRGLLSQEPRAWWTGGRPWHRRPRAWQQRDVNGGRGDWRRGDSGRRRRQRVLA
jgi:hypothetical protein